MKCCTMTAQKFWMIGSCTTVLLFALTIGLLWPTISIRYLLYPQLKLKNHTINYENWKETPVPMYLEIYLFNWTNADQLYNTSVTPNFVEMGPYVFLEKHIRTNVTWSNDETTVDFYQKRVWHFVPELSNGSLEDEVTNVNPIVAACGYTSRYLSNAMKFAINFLISGERGPFFVTRTVNELLFEGYDDALLKVIRASNDPTFPKIPFDRMGWFYSRNNSETYDGKFRMFTGVDEITKLGILQMWNGKKTTNLYRDNCSDIRGTSGELWPPIENNEKPDISIFAPDICRNIDLKYDSEVEMLGLKGHKWVADESVFDNGYKHPEMSCYCSAEKESCPDLASGVFNASSCKWHSPAFVLFPHFYLADQVYLENLTGMNPQKEKHEFTVALEPQTGIPLKVSAALQINLLIKPWQGITKFRDVPQLFAPVLWFRQKAELTEELANQAKVATNLPSIGSWIAYGLFGLGILIAISSVLCYIFNWKRTEENDDGQEQPILDD
ncbi:hypothetical protein PVAND_004467 [Polypedilum vanderplanki]|uniref:Uncharacterized protein n=1 Tax=Polypedilum vanderplanki TaxID=319348 RepID=A0A9J6BX27_POLVA|nr:hypothetical protein PVAND_004467 [Polypedilum vanderplanki]